MSNEQVNNDKVNFLEDFYEMLSKEVLIAYRGTFERSVLSVLASNIETSVENDSILRRKFFKIFLELAQNISRFAFEQTKTSDGDKSGTGLFIIKHDANSYFFISGNIIKNSDIKKLHKIINHINSLNREEMRIYKREQYKLTEKEQDSSLGLVQMALVSGKDISISIKEIDDISSFVIISIEISK